MIKQLKFLFSLFFVGVTALSLASCGGDDDDDDYTKGKFQPVSINGITYYNCLEAVAYLCSNFSFDDNHLIWTDGRYNQYPAVKFDINLYDEPNIEAYDLEGIYFVIPQTSFSNGSNISNEFFQISVGKGIKKSWTADKKEDYKVVSGKAYIKSISGDKATVVFDNYKISIKGESVAINGSVTCEKSNL